MTCLDRDAAREALFDAHPADWEPRDASVEDLLDALEGCVRPAPQQTIDRDELLDLLDNMSTTSTEWREKVADRVLALLRPVDGVVINRDEVETVLQWSVTAADVWGGEVWSDGDQAVVEKIDRALG